MDRYQNFWRRFWAGLIDTFVLWPIWWIDDYVKSAGWPILLLISWIVIRNFIYLFYFVYLHASFGQTLGKNLLGIKVLDVSEERLPSLRQSFMRDIGNVIINLIASVNEIYTLQGNASTPPITWLDLSLSFASMGWFLLEIISMRLNPKRRAVHDFIARTVVVRTATQAVKEPSTLSSSSTTPDESTRYDNAMNIHRRDEDRDSSLKKNL